MRRQVKRYTPFRPLEMPKLDRGDETDPTRISLRGATAQLFPAEKPPEPWPMPTSQSSSKTISIFAFLQSKAMPL